MQEASPTSRTHVANCCQDRISTQYDVEESYKPRRSPLALMYKANIIGTESSYTRCPLALSRHCWSHSVTKQPLGGFRRHQPRGHLGKRSMKSFMRSRHACGCRARWWRRSVSSTWHTGVRYCQRPRQPYLALNHNSVVHDVPDGLPPRVRLVHDCQQHHLLRCHRSMVCMVCMVPDAQALRRPWWHRISTDQTPSRSMPSQAVFQGVVSPTRPPSASTKVRVLMARACTRAAVTCASGRVSGAGGSWGNSHYLGETQLHGCLQ